MSAVPVTLDIADAARRLEDASAVEVLRWASMSVPRLAVTSSFGADSAVLLHLVGSVAPDLPVLFLDTGYHFPETLAFRRDLARRLGLTDVRDVRPVQAVAEQAREHGGGLYLRAPDRCCALRKVAPLEAALAGFDGWATGVRRGQTAARADLPVVDVERRGDRTRVKVAPLAGWSDDDVADYLDRHDLPRHPLADAGFSSIGCAPCTRPAVADGDPRDGRWQGQAKTECGIHLSSTQTT